MAPLKDIDPYDSPLHFFGNEMRQHRLRLELSQPQVARACHCGADLISKIETGEAPPAIELAEALDERFGTHGSLKRLAGMVRRTAVFPSWYGPFVEAEQRAHTVRSWQPLVVPGLLQTEGYARALLQTYPGLTQQRVEELLVARLERQGIFAREEPPVALFIMAEGVLHYPVGDATIMREQLGALLETAASSHVNVQVVPAEAGPHPGLAGAFDIAGMSGAPDVVYLDAASKGPILERPEDVAEILRIYDAIRTEALPARASLDLIAKVKDTEWKA